jgi:replicative DNA helicase
VSQDDKKFSTSVSFAEYGKSFQEKVVQALLSDWKFAEQMLEVIDVSYFELKYLVFLVDRYFAYAKKYKVFPTLQLLVTIIKDDLKAGTDTNLRDQIIDYLQRMRANPDPGDLQYVKEKSLDFCRKQALKRALEDAVDQMAANKYESIVEGIKKATLVGTAPALGHDFFLDFEARFTRLQRSAVSTGIDELDKKEILNGGLGKGEIGVIIAPTGVGKSHFLVMLGSNAIRAGVDVLHYTFELSEAAVGMRYDSNLCDIDSNLVIDNKDKVIESYKDAKLGRLMIKEFPSNTATIYTIRSHIERLDVKGFKPGLIIIDYADIMRSTRQYDSLRHELKLIYEELRGFAMEKGIPVWTASQSNKEGATSDIVDLGNMSEAYGKAMVADVVLSISRKAHEKSSGWGRLYIAKNRAGRDGIVYPVKIDTARSKFDIAGRAGSLEEAATDDEDSIKKALRTKWRELKSELKFEPKGPPVAPNDDKKKDDDEGTSGSKPN